MSYRIYLKMTLRNWLIDLILVLQIGISVILANALIGNINLIRTTTSLLGPMAEHSGGFYMPLSRETDFSFLDGFPGIDNIFSIDQYLLNYNGTEIPVFAYDPEVINLFSPKIARGEWLCSSNNSTLSLPAVMVSNNLKINIGDQILCNSIDRTEVPLNIVGELASPAYILNFNTTSNNLQPNHLLRYYDYIYNGYPVFLVCKTHIEKYISSPVATQISRAIIFSESITTQQLQALKNEINKHGGFTSFRDVMLRGESQQSDTIKQFLPFLICGFSISLIGIVSISILNSVTNIRIYSVLYILGCPWKNILRLCIGYVSIISTLSLLFVALSYHLLNAAMESQPHGIILSGNNLIVTLIIYFMFLIVSVLTFSFSLDRNAPIQTLRNSEI